jgi:hypothetical protein
MFFRDFKKTLNFFRRKISLRFFAKYFALQKPSYFTKKCFLKSLKNIKKSENKQGIFSIFWAAAFKKRRRAKIAWFCLLAKILAKSVE